MEQIKKLQIEIMYKDTQIYTLELRNRELEKEIKILRNKIKEYEK